MRHFLILMLAGCQTLKNEGPDPGTTTPMSVQDGWQTGTLLNNSKTSGAAQAATVLLETQLRRRQLLKGAQAVSASRYQVNGDITQWHYIGNVSPRPVVAVQIDIKDLQNQTVVWSRSVQKTGLRSQSLTDLADSLLKTVVEQIPLADNAEAGRELGAAVASQMSANDQFGKPGKCGYSRHDGFANSCAEYHATRGSDTFTIARACHCVLLRGRSCHRYIVAI